MDKITKGMIKALIARLEHISNPQLVSENKPTPDAHGESNIETGHSDLNIPGAPTPSQPPPTETHYHVTYQPEKDWWDKSKRYVEIGGAILLAIYTLYTIKMYCANKEAADAAKSAANTARDALVISESPFVAQTKIVLRPLIVGKRPQVDIEYINSGKLPAVDFGLIAFVEVRAADPLTVNTNGVAYPVELDSGIPLSSVVTADAPFTVVQQKGIASGSLHVYAFGILQWTNPITKLTALKVFCARDDPQREDRQLVGCATAPQLMMNNRAVQRPPTSEVISPH